MASKIWGKVPETIKMSTESLESLESCKSKIRKLKPECDCRFCTTYLHHVSFVNVIKFLFILVLLMF